ATRTNCSGCDSDGTAASLSEAEFFEALDRRSEVDRVFGHYAQATSRCTRPCSPPPTRNAWRKLARGAQGTDSESPQRTAASHTGAPFWQLPSQLERCGWWAHLMGAVRVHPHKHCANYPPQEDRGEFEGSDLWRIRFRLHAPASLGRSP